MSLVCRGLKFFVQPLFPLVMPDFDPLSSVVTIISYSNDSSLIMFSEKQIRSVDRRRVDTT